MKELTINTLRTNLNNITKSVDESNLQAVLVNAVFHALKHGNILAPQMKAIRNSNANAKFKAALNKRMPMTWDKTKEKYTFSAKKQATIIETLELGEDFTLEDVDKAIPNAFVKAPRKPTEYDRAKALATLAKKLHDHNEPMVDEIMAITAALLANPELVNKATRAVMGAQVEEVPEKVAA